METSRRRWSVNVEMLEPNRVQRLTLQGDGEPVSFADVLEAWQDDGAFRRRFSAALAESPFAAFRWETPVLREATVSREFQCVLVATSDMTPDPVTFAEHFESDPETAVLAFDNLGGDARLVVPAPRASDGAYPHLAAFLRRAPESQRDELWRVVAREVTKRLGPRPLWLSTAGGGVAWLHVRLDSTPKYYVHAPYRHEADGRATEPRR